MEQQKQITILLSLQRIEKKNAFSQKRIEAYQANCLFLVWNTGELARPHPARGHFRRSRSTALFFAIRHNVTEPH